MRIPDVVRIYALLGADELVRFVACTLQDYLTDVWGLSFTQAAGIQNLWEGIIKVLPILFSFLVDEHMGNIKMLALTSIAYSMGLFFLYMSNSLLLGTCEQCYRRQAILYTGMAFVAAGRAGLFVSVRPFLGEQHDATFYRSVINYLNRLGLGNNWPVIKYLGNLGLAIRSETKYSRVPCLASIAVISLIISFILSITAQSFTKWILPATGIIQATLFYLGGRHRYKRVPPQGSPLTNVCRVIVASYFKKSKPFPLDANELYRKEYQQESQPLSRTRFLRCLDKAAIKLPDVSIEDQVRDRWRLCSVEEVEEAKFTVGMVPMWTTFIVCGIVSSIGNTYFVEQANHMNSHIGKCEVPFLVLQALYMLVKSGLGALAKFVLKKSGKYGPPAGIAVAMIFSVLCCVTAATTESRRLDVVRRHRLLEAGDDVEVPMSVFWLGFQFFLLASLISFFEKSVAAFYEDQAPESMQNCLEHLSEGVSGLGFMCGVLSVEVVGRISERGGKPSWFRDTLNESRLDKYYWVLAALSNVNLMVFVLVASCYKYKNRRQEQDEQESDMEVELSGGICFNRIPFRL